jgi:hypothetical protein
MSKKQEEKTWYPNAELVQKIHETMLENMADGQDSNVE